MKITGKDIESTMGFCAIPEARTGRIHLLHVECKAPGNQIIWATMFTQRDDGALDFDVGPHLPAVSTSAASNRASRALRHCRA